MSQSTGCWVCGEEEATEQLLSTCDSCGQTYHLNPYRSPGKDCGDAAIVGEEPTLQFLCQPCIDGTTGPLLEGQSARP